jgi:hypothetical protein
MKISILFLFVFCNIFTYENGSADQRKEYLDQLEESLLRYETTIGRLRFNSLRACMEEVENNQIPGDFIETGVQRGVVTIFMRGFLAAYGNKERQVWVADSFAGFPPSTRLDEQGISNAIFPDLVVPLETVMNNFKKFNLLDDRVHFIKGFFCDTLSKAPIEKLAILRLDGDLYSSTMDCLEALYPKLSIGGYIIIDDYGHWPC